MSKTVGANLLTHIQLEVTTLAMLWKLTREDTTVLGFTNHDRDIVYGGVTYEADSGFTPTNIENKNDLSVDNLDIQTLIKSETITEADLMAGLYDNARIDVWLVNYEDLAMGHIILAGNWTVGEIQIKDNNFVGEVRSLKQKLDKSIVERYSAECRAQLGDTRCGVNLATYTVTGSVDTVISTRSFTDAARTEATDVFAYGKLTWTSGNNSGRSVEVKSFTPASDTVLLYEAMPEAIQVGDEYSLIYGCDKISTTCSGRFSNLYNFRGEPLVPTYDKILQRPDSR